VVVAYFRPPVRFPVLLVPFAVLCKVLEFLDEGDGVRGFAFTVATEGIEVCEGEWWGGGRVVHMVLHDVVVDGCESASIVVVVLVVGYGRGGVG
jgi:hypothetical protein